LELENFTVVASTFYANTSVARNIAHRIIFQIVAGKHKKKFIRTGLPASSFLNFY